MRPLLAASAVIFLCAGRVPAQTPPATPSPVKMTLAAALGEARPPVKGVALAVGADNVTLPPDAVLPGVTPTVAETAALYSRSSQRFGTVTAVAPPTMVVLNTAPDEPNIYADVPALDAFTLLTASLTDAQWQALTSEGGLGVSGLSTPEQRQLFAALLSHDGKLLVRPQYAAGEKWDKDRRDLTDQIPQARLRLGQTITLSLPSKDQPNISYGDAVIPPPPGVPRRYEVDEREDHDNSADSDYGAIVRAEMPNVPKRGQLDFSAAVLQANIPLIGVKTVGDLVSRVGRATRTELYVDARLEKKTMTLVGAGTAPAADLLRALAFCLTGTFRQVGPAYVLTDDIVGIGTRRQIWAEFEEEADALRRGPVLAASNALYARHTPRDLPWFGDPGAYSPEEEKAVSEAINTRGAFLPELKLPLSQLTTAQQDMARRGVEKWNSEYTLQPVTTDGVITVRPGLSAQLLIPGMDTPVDLNLNHGGTEQYFLFQMPQDEVDARIRAEDEQRLKEHPEWAALLAKMPDKAPLADVWTSLKSAPRRGALVHPRTAKDVDAEVDAAKTLGLTELWLDVFSGGVAHIPGLPLSTAKPLPHGANDILTEALARTRGTPLRVLPVLDLLFWGQALPAQDADLNLLGETSAQAAARWQQRKASLPEGQRMSEEAMSNAVIPDWPGVAVCPLAPDVQNALGGLVRSVAARPGVAGLVWREMDTPGYGLLPGGSDTSSLLLGYHESMRLAFLRRFHADPVDLYDVGHSGTRANTELPNFTGDGSGHELYRLHDAWVQFRQDVAPAFLRTLYAAADPPGAPPGQRVRVLVKQRNRGQHGSDHSGLTHYPPGWYGSWDDPRQPPPTLHTMGEDDKPGQPAQPVADAATQARSQSQIVVTPITGETLDQMRQALSFRRTAGLRRGPTAPVSRIAPSPGFVLDLGDAPEGDLRPGEDPLTALAAQMTSAPPHSGPPER